MSNPTTPFSWQMPTATDLVTDLPADFEVFGQAVATSMGDLLGGTTGQVLKKNTNADMDFVWAADSAGMTNPMTTTGDTIYSSSGSTPARLAIGSTGNILTVAGGVPTWSAPSGGGKVLQVVSAVTTTSTTIATTSLTDTSITATITPTSATSKILILLSYYVYFQVLAEGINFGGALLRGATTIIDYDNFKLRGHEVTSSTGNYIRENTTISYYDAPATTSALTYKLQARLNSTANSRSTTWQSGSIPSTITLMEIGA